MADQDDKPMKFQLLTLKQVQDLVPLSHSQFYRMMRAGTFPQSVKVGGRRVAWRVPDIMAWIDHCEPIQRP